MLKNPTKYFTKEILDKLDVAAGKEFLYGEMEIEEESSLEEARKEGEERGEKTLEAKSVETTNEEQ
jgi:hypothetical protein